jgi:hypothetical protein
MALLANTSMNYSSWDDIPLVAPMPKPQLHTSVPHVGPKIPAHLIPVWAMIGYEGGPEEHYVIGSQHLYEAMWNVSGYASYGDPLLTQLTLGFKTLVVSKGDFWTDALKTFSQPGNKDQPW